jgi:hypothetical protein
MGKTARVRMNPDREVVKSRATRDQATGCEEGSGTSHNEGGSRREAARPEQNRRLLSEELLFLLLV